MNSALQLNHKCKVYTISLFVLLAKGTNAKVTFNLIQLANVSADTF